MVHVRQKDNQVKKLKTITTKKESQYNLGKVTTMLTILLWIIQKSLKPHIPDNKKFFSVI